VPVAGLMRRLTRRQAATSTPWRFARWLAAGSALLGIVFLLALTWTVVEGSGEFLYGLPVTFTLLLAVPVVVLAAAVGAAVCTVRGWRGSGASVVARVHQVVVLAGMVALGWFFWQWNLIGWQY